MRNIQGLSQSQAEEQLKKFGYNEIPEKRDSNLKRLLKKLWSPIPGMIEVAAILSAIAQKWEDFFINEIKEHLEPLKVKYEVKITKEQ